MSVNVQDQLNLEQTAPELAATRAEVVRLNEQAWDLRKSNPEQMLALAQQTNALAHTIEYREGLAYSLFVSANAYWRLANYPRALEDAQTCLDLYRELDNKSNQARTLNTTATIYIELCDYQTALDYLLKAVTIYEDLNLVMPLATVLGNIAAIYTRLEQFLIALEYFQRAITALERHEAQDTNSYPLLLNNAGFNYLKLGQYSEALDYQHRALAALGETENQYVLGYIYSNLGETHRHLKQFEVSLDFLLKAAAIWEQIYKASLCETLLELGNLYSDTEQYAQAEERFAQALASATETGRRDVVYQIHLAYSKLYRKMSDPTRAFEHYEQYAAIRAEVSNSENQKAMVAAQARFQVEKTEREREIFRLRNVELAGALQKVETANREIATLNTRLEAENLRMESELQITRRLQQMVLPNKQELDEVCKDGLDVAAFMQPATEVGGDYYDVLRYPNGVKLGIGDVTGHGLESGVLMLMVQTAIRTLVTSQEQDTLRFMNLLNRTIYDNVQRMGSAKNLTLALLDYKRREGGGGHLSLCGQHEQMIIVRQDGRLEQIDTIDLGFPVGLEEDISEFVGVFETDLAAGDVVVLYTDGITEATNTANQDYGSEQLCQIVQAHHTENAHKIKHAVISDLLDFIGTQEIFDDITLVVLKQVD